jgi:hypothetical protein
VRAGSSEAPSRDAPPGPGVRRARRRRTAVLAASGLAALLAALVLVGQLVLPGIAADRVRTTVGRYGPVRSVSVSATPAVELLWGGADRITVIAGSLRMAPSQLADLEQRLRGVARAQLRAGRLDLALSSAVQGSIGLSDVRLTKEGRLLTVRGIVRERDLRLALPAGISVTGLEGAEGALRLTLEGGLAGVRVSGEAQVGAHEGAIVAWPVGVPLASLVAFTVFSDPRIAVESVSAVPAEGGYAVTVRARQTD